MAPPNTVLSPDGAYYWDGQAWRPTQPAAPVVAQQQPADRPSWLPADSAPPAVPSPPLPEQHASAAYDAAPSASTPAWAAQAPPGNGSRTMVMAGAGLILLLLLGVAGYTIFQGMQQNVDVNTTSQLSTPSPIVSPTAQPTAAAALPLTAELDGEYCPVAHLNKTACWRGSLLDTGPRIGKLALIFVTGGGYTNWFATHTNPMLSGFYTTPGCELDVPHGRMLCDSVAPGGSISVYLVGDTSKRGTFHYAVKFADVSSGSPVYVDQNPDGTHQVVSWYERIT